MLAEKLNPATRTTVAVKMIEAALRLDSDVDLALRWH
jgi:hypothetical protein